MVICRLVNGSVVPDDQPYYDLQLAGVDEPPRELRMAETSPGCWVPSARNAQCRTGALIYECVGVAGHVDGVRVFLFHTG